MTIKSTTSLGSLLNFSNGKSSPERSDDGPFAVFGSNGIIGRASENNASRSTIVIGRVGTYCGSLHYSPAPCWVTDNAIKAVARENNDPLYLFYLLGTLRLNDRRAGSGQPLLNQQILSNIAVFAPPPGEQAAIAAVLSAFDNKIDLNRRMNETLEASARALFRDWFVDFGPTRAKAEGRPAYLAPDLWSLFPGRLEDDGVPEGWDAFTVGDLAEHHTASINPAAAGEELFEHYSLPAFDSGGCPALDLGGSIKSNKTVVPADAVLLSKLNPEIPRVWVPNDAAELRQVASTEFLAFVPKAPASRSLLFTLFRDDAFRQIMEGMVTGTSKSHQRISPPALRGMEAVVGNPTSFQAFDRMVAPIIAKTLRNRAESRTLAAIRDTLLPKLMSGEIRVRDAEALAA